MWGGCCPLTSKCPRWRRAAERLAKHTDTSGLPGGSWDAACRDQRTAAASGDPSQDPLSRACRIPSLGIPPQELLLAPHRSPSTTRGCRTPSQGSPHRIPLAVRCCGTPSSHTYLGVEPQGSLVVALLEFPVSLLPVPACGLRLLVRGCLVAQPHQGCLLLLLAPVGYGVSTKESVWNHLVAPPCSSRMIPEHAAQDCVQRGLEYLQ